MKNYILCSLALVMAVAFSAFRPAVAKKATTTGYDYWYETQNNGTEIGTVYISTPGTDKEAALMQIDCEDYSNRPVCLFGSNSPSLVQGDPLPALAPDAIIKHNRQ